MRPLPVVVAMAGGWGRAVLIATCTALVSGLLLVAVAMSRLSTPGNMGWESPSFRAARLMAPLADPGTRGGTIFAVVLVTLPVLALLNQGVRLGTVARVRRYDALQVAGATPSDLRRWAALEVGVPAAAGAVLGIGVWWMLRELLGRRLADGGTGAIVPPETGPGLWALVVVVVVAGVGALVGAWSVHGRGTPRDVRFPVRWATPLVVGALLLWWSSRMDDADSRLVVTVPAIVLLLSGVTGLAPWLTSRTAQVLMRRTRSAPALLAGRRLVDDPRPAARAALAAGAGGLTIGVLGGLMADLDAIGSDPYDEHYQAMKLVAVLTVVGFLLIAVALAIHIVDSVVSERRAYAALSAVGFSTRSLLSALHREALVATLPVAVLGALLGAGGFPLLAQDGGPWLRWGALALSATVLTVVLSTFLAAALVAPVVRSATLSETLRTE
jgi:hypothetical protein